MIALLSVDYFLMVVKNKCVFVSISFALFSFNSLSEEKTENFEEHCEAVVVDGNIYRLEKIETEKHHNNSNDGLIRSTTIELGYYDFAGNFRHHNRCDHNGDGRVEPAYTELRYYAELSYAQSEQRWMEHGKYKEMDWHPNQIYDHDLISYLHWFEHQSGVETPIFRDSKSGPNAKIVVLSTGEVLIEEWNERNFLGKILKQKRYAILGWQEENDCKYFSSGEREDITTEMINDNCYEPQSGLNEHQLDIKYKISR